MPNLPAPEVFCLETPLYHRIPLQESDLEHLQRLKDGKPRLKFDAYCIWCQDRSTFGDYTPRGSNLPVPPLDYFRSCVIRLDMMCARDASHVMIFYFRIYNQAIQKIGQYPSLASIKQGEYSRQTRVLGEADRKEFNRALGLTAHGIGIGAFVYLRRIFERLINDTYRRARVGSTDVDAGFEQHRMDEKIALLHDHLPPALVENKPIYAILSKGIHDLEEEECLAYFPIVKDAIVMILEQELSRREQEKMAEQLRKEINEISQKLKKGGQ